MDGEADAPLLGGGEVEVVHSADVLDVEQLEDVVDAGRRFPEGTAIDLVVGLGSGTDEVVVPNLLMKSVDQARAALLARQLSLGGVHYDEAETEENKGTFVIYEQDPRPEAYTREGSPVEVYLTTDAAKAQAAAEEMANDEFFEEGMVE